MCDEGNFFITIENSIPNDAKRKDVTPMKMGNIGVDVLMNQTFGMLLDPSSYFIGKATYANGNKTAAPVNRQI